MPNFYIRMINSEFDSTGQSEHASLEDALRDAVRTAVRVAADVIAGDLVTAVEVRVSDKDKVLARNVVTLCVAHLSPGI